MTPAARDAVLLVVAKACGADDRTFSYAGEGEGHGHVYIDGFKRQAYCKSLKLGARTTLCV
jgi:hypothetical protein